MNNVTIRNSNGLGLTLFDVDGLVNTNNCVFENNRVAAQDADHIPGGGGVYVEFAYCPPGRYDDNCTWYSDTSKTKTSTYYISNSNFTNNNASHIKHHKTDFYINDHARYQGFGRGGGVQVTFRGKSLVKCISNICPTSTISEACILLENTLDYADYEKRVVF